jgi:hypothetical protein
MNAIRQGCPDHGKPSKHLSGLPLGCTISEVPDQAILEACLKKNVLFA